MADIQTKSVTFSEAVLLRPQMYTLGGTFEEAIAFLEGYYSGIARGNPYAEPVREWEGFRKWLSNRLCVDTSEVFSKFLERQEDSQAALRKLSEWLTSFLEESKTQGMF